MGKADSSRPAPLPIAHIGAFSMPNWGDKLYPGAVASMLEQLGVAAQLSHYCPVPGRTSAGERIRTLDHVRSSGARLALVGGGDILRFDDRTVAMDHLSVPTANRHRRVNRLRARVFAKRHFLKGPGPWAPSKPWLKDAPAVLISAGVHTVPDRAAARRAVANYRGAWVRTDNGADRLAGAGVPRENIVIAPDMIFALPDLLRPEEVRERGQAIFAKRVRGGDAPILFHAAQFHGWPVERVAAALRSLQGLPVATLSLGSYAGEDRMLARAARGLGIPTLHDLDADDITAVMAAAGAVFSTSMHAAIVSASFGTPVLVPGVGKTRDAFAVCPEPPLLREVEDATVAEVAREVIGTRVPHSIDANRDAATEALRDVLEISGAV